MLIEKQFSSYDDYGYEDERVYSVLMDEEELRLYSEFLEEREYNSKARKLLNNEADIKVGREEGYYNNEDYYHSPKWGPKFDAKDLYDMTNGKTFLGNGKETWRKLNSDPYVFKDEQDRIKALREGRRRRHSEESFRAAIKAAIERCCK